LFATGWVQGRPGHQALTGQGDVTGVVLNCGWVGHIVGGYRQTACVREIYTGDVVPLLNMG